MIAALQARTWSGVKRLPKTPLNHLFVLAINRVLGEALANGQLDFLNEMACCVQIRDLNWSFTLGKQQTKLLLLERAADVTISADTQSFVQLMARQIDPDTLFFQRRLLITGNTELGLQIKNFLDQFEFPTAYKPLEWCVAKVAEHWH